MPTFAYTAKASPEKTLSGTIEAPGRGQAIQQLRSMGYVLVSLEESREAAGGLAFSLSWQQLRRIRSADLAMFWRQLASLLDAGLPLVRALETAQLQTENPKLAEVIARVRASVENASSLSQALGRFPRVFGSVAVSIIASGEATGTLAQVVEQLANKVEKEQDLRGKLRSALIYPSFLLLVGVVVIGVLVTFVIPRFEVLFTSLGQELPAVTRALLAVSGFAQAWWWLVLLAAVAAAAALRQAVRTETGRRLWDRLKLHAPVLGKVIGKIEMARFAHTFGTLVSNGVHILPALEITAQTMNNKVIADEIAEVRERIAKGSRVDAAMRRSRYFPPAMTNMVAVGEDSASLDAMLEKVAIVFERDSDRVVGAMTKLLESVLILVLGALVAVIVAAILLPIFQTSGFAG